MDSSRTAWQRAGEPVFFETALSSLKRSDGSKMFGPGIVEAKRRGPPAVGGATVWVTVLSCLFGVILLALAWRWQPSPGPLAGTLIGAWGVFCGVFGTVMLILHWTSLWPETRENWLMAGALPLDLLLLVPAFSLLRGHARFMSWVMGYIRLRVCLLFAALVLELLIDAHWGPVGPRLILLGGWLFVNRVLDQSIASVPARVPG